MPTDITDREACEALVTAAQERFGGVDYLVQNAHHEGDWTAVADADPDSWRRVFEVNLYGALHLAQAGVTAMRERGGGAIVLVNSGAVLLDPPALGAYTTSKAALASLARTLAVEVGQWGIRVNGVFLGGVAGDNILHAARGRVRAHRDHRRGLARAARRDAPAPRHADARPVRRRRAVPLLGPGRGRDRPAPQRERRAVDHLNAAGRAGGYRCPSSARSSDRKLRVVPQRNSGGTRWRVTTAGRNQRGT